MKNKAMLLIPNIVALYRQGIIDIKEKNYLVMLCNNMMQMQRDYSDFIREKIESLKNIYNQGTYERDEIEKFLEEVNK